MRACVFTCTCAFVCINGVTMTDCTGPSTISSSQQMMLDNLDDHDVSPNMKQCRGEDDTSSGMSSSYYRIAQNFGRVKLWRINCFMSFCEENVGEFTIANISYFSELRIWLGKILQMAFILPNSLWFSPARILRYTVYIVVLLNYFVWCYCCVLQ